MRTVCVAPDRARAEQARRFYADQQPNGELSGECVLTYRVHKMPDGWRCTGYTPAELRAIAEEKADAPF